MSPPSDQPPVAPTQCPVCAGALAVERLRCASCGTALEGRFAKDWVHALSRDQLGFVRVFLACRGKIKDVEAALGISYPTVVSRLDEVVGAVERAAKPEAPARTHRRVQILDDLAKGAIDAEEAVRRLKGS